MSNNLNIFTFEEQDIDLKDSSKIKIKCFTNDDIILKMNVYNYGEGVNLSDFNKEIRFTKPDGTIYSETNEITFNNNLLTVVCDRQLTAVEGVVTGHLRLWNTQNKQKSSYPIEVVVQRTSDDDENASQSIVSVTQKLDSSINKAKELEAHFDDNINKANTVSVELKANVTNATNIKSNLEKSNATATNTKNDLDRSNTTASETKKNLDNSNNTALSTKNALDSINTSATNTKNALNTSINNANNSKSALDTSKSNADSSKIALDKSVATANETKRNLDGSNTIASKTKTDLDASKSNADSSKIALDKSIATATTTKTNLDGSNTNATNTKNNLDKSNTTANETKKNLDGSVANANNSKGALDTSIANATKTKSDLDGSNATASKTKVDLDASNTTATTTKNNLNTSIATGNTLKTNLDNANTQATKNIKALTEFGDATDLAKDVEVLKKQTLENNYTSMETDGILTKLESARDGFVDNMVIGGKTIQNVFNNAEPKYRDINKLTYSINGDTVTANLNSDNSCWVGYDSSLNHAILKRNTTYTFVFNMIDYPDTVTGIKINGGTSTDIFATPFTLKESFKKGLNIGKFTTSTDASLNFGIIMMSNGAPSGSKFKFSKNILILEGDWTDKEIPPYFEGIKSVGEGESNKVSVKTRNKNFYSYSTSDTGKIGSNMVYNRESLNKIIYTASSDITIPTGVYKVFTVPYGKYNLSFDVQAIGGNVTIKDMGLENIYTIQNATISPNKGIVHYSVNGYSKKHGVTVVLYVNKMSAGSKFIISNIQLEQGQSETTFEPYKEDTTKILLKQPLRSLPNGVKDTVDFEKGIVTRNVGVMTLTGNEDWQKITTNAEKNVVSCQYRIQSIGSSLDMACISNIPAYPATVLWNNIDSLGIGINSVSNIQIKVEKTKLETQDVAGVKKWLQKNNVILYYQLATPTTEKIEIKDTLQTFKDGYIQLENSITPVVNLDFSTNYPSIVASMKEKLDALMDRMAIVEAYIIEKASESIIKNI